MTRQRDNQLHGVRASLVASRSRVEPAFAGARYRAFAATLAREERSEPIPEKTVKRWLLDCDAALASDDGPIFSTVAKLVEALKRSIPERTQNAELKKKPCASRVNYSRGTKYEE